MAGTVPTMHVVERGAGTPLVLVHGFGVDHRLLLPLDEVIEAAGGWRRIYLDLPGTEGTPIGEVTGSEDVVAVVEREIRNRVGDEPFAVLGNSYGGMIARRVAHDFRPNVLGLAALAAVFVADHEQRNVPDRITLHRDPGLRERLGAAGETFAADAVVESAENAEAFIEHVWPGLRSVDEDGLARIAAHYALDAEPEDASPEPFTQPSLFITGRQDHVVGYRDAWNRVEHYPRSTFVTLDAVGHNVHLEQTTVTAALITDWLGRIRSNNDG